MNFVSRVQTALAGFEWSHTGFAPLERPFSMDLYRAWLAAGHHGDMEYLRTQEPLKADPKRFAPKANSAIVVAKPYLPHPYPHNKRSLQALKIAQYARGEDYHRRFRTELEASAEQLRREFVDDEFLCYTDSAPILERDLAARAGLGWIGKNTCLIHPKHGSLFFIGEILTSLSLEQSSTVADACGTCDRCIRACPTGALEEPRKLNATKCIAYWTIEAKAAAPEDLRSEVGEWFFGCDICQTVCPWNEKHHGKDVLLSLYTKPSRTQLVEDLRFILEASGKELERQWGQTPLLRARPFGLKRNALLVIAKQKVSELESVVAELAEVDGKLKPIAAWCLQQLSC